MLSFLAVLLAAGAAFAQMGGGHMGGGHMGRGTGSGQMSGGSGYGMHGAAGNQNSSGQRGPKLTRYIKGLVEVTTIFFLAQEKGK